MAWRLSVKGSKERGAGPSRENAVASRNERSQWTERSEMHRREAEGHAGISEAEHFQGWQAAGRGHEWEDGMKVKSWGGGAGHLHSHRDC